MQTKFNVGDTVLFPCRVDGILVEPGDISIYKLSPIGTENPPIISFTADIASTDKLFRAYQIEEEDYE